MGPHYRYTSGMSVKRVPPGEASNLLAQGYKYLDVRSIPEFQQGHPQGAYNIPLAHMMPGGRMAPNPDFPAVVAKHFAKTDRLLIGCKSGGRSLRAAEILAGAGFTDVIDVNTGFDGWTRERLPVATASPGRGYEDLK
jgi:rhodanese-related sulfurtransferase